MANLSIPVRGDLPNYDFTIDLEGTVYLFEFKWNERTSRWTFDLSTEEGDLIVSGIPLVVNSDLLGRFKDSRLPAGTMTAWDTSGEDREIELIADLGDRVLLVYQEATS